MRAPCSAACWEKYSKYGSSIASRVPEGSYRLTCFRPFHSEKVDHFLTRPGAECEGGGALVKNGNASPASALSARMPTRMYRIVGRCIHLGLSIYVSLALNISFSLPAPPPFLSRPRRVFAGRRIDGSRTPRRVREGDAGRRPRRA